MWNFIKELRRKDHQRYLGGLDFFKYIGPGLLVTVGFIDPGNWASNFAAGADFGYSLLWVITLSTIMLIVLQHNVAHLGIVTGLCLSEAATKYTPKWVSRPILGTAVLASISTSLAEILGGAIALEMLFDIPIIWGSLLTAFFVTIMLFTNSYKRIERSIIAFVSVIGLSFLYELFLVDIDWPLAARSWVTPSIPEGSLLVIMSVLGAVVMPHNLFLHSEVVQSREYNKKDDASIRKLLKYEFYAKQFRITFEKPVDPAISEVGTYGIENLEWTPEVYFADNVIRNNRARGSLFSTPKKTVVEKNVFDHTSGTAILLCGDCNGWFETGACHDVQIRNNKFINALTNQFQFTNAVISIYPEIPDLKSQKRYFHSGIVIEDNEFETFDMPILYAKSVDGLVFRNNVIRQNHDYPAFHWNNHRFFFQRVVNVEIKDSRFDGGFDEEKDIRSEE